ncbi:hypothetical protein TcasGA2_TC012460 [Tribolium castaneum]|uniref:Uncharacterized protein n=1 Tax=Tribolium castaneum TaxID=7070 RepID=D6X2F0_TRICA|nr:hypothetical protein TcasGA2_TC012460 [Tribolium castaneum]
MNPVLRTNRCEMSVTANVASQSSNFFNVVFTEIVFSGNRTRTRDTHPQYHSNHNHGIIAQTMTQLIITPSLTSHEIKLQIFNYSKLLIPKSLIIPRHRMTGDIYRQLDGNNPTPPLYFGWGYASLDYDRLVATLAGLLTVAKRRPKTKRNFSKQCTRSRPTIRCSQKGGMHASGVSKEEESGKGRSAVKQLNRDRPPVTGIQN